MTDIIERAKALLEDVTEGPWEAINVGNVHWGVSSEGYDFPTVVKANCSYDGFGNGSRRSDAEFIAASRDLVPELVAEVDRLRAWTLKVKNDDTRGICPVCSYLWSECECNIGLQEPYCPDDPMPHYTQGDYSADLYHGIEG